MKRRVFTVVLVLLALAALPFPSQAYDIPMGESVVMKVKGDLTYAVKVRTEDPDPVLVYQAGEMGEQLAEMGVTGSDNPVLSHGDKNFEKWDVVSNRGIARLEIELDSEYLTLFGKGEAFYDHANNKEHIYDPDDTDLRTTDIKYRAIYSTEALEYYIDLHASVFSLRVGKQIVQWGDSLAPVFAVGVNTINPFDGSKAGAAGYSFRDYQVGSLMAWSTVELTDTIAIEGVYAPDFDPRYTVPVVGTFSSFMDGMGFGSDGSLVDKRPVKFEDLQQYGGALKKIFPSLDNLELGLYYFHHLDHGPSLTTGMSGVEATYEEIDMYGMSFSTIFDLLGLGIQINGEAAYRPNDTGQVDYILDQATLAIMQAMAPTNPMAMLPAGTNVGAIGGFEEIRTLNWVLGGMKSASDVFSFLPWIINFDPQFEFYGGNNLDYDKDKNFSDPKHTVYYMGALGLSCSDMFDNSKVTLTVNGSGAIHEEKDKQHNLGSSIKVNYGDSIEVFVGYDYILGDVEKQGSIDADRDAVSFKFTYYLI